MLTPVELNAGAVRMLDQRKLPHEESWIDLANPTEVADAIRDMIIRGAPAIGISAAFGLVLSARAAAAGDVASFDAAIERDAVTLRAARPTAVNLGWALDRMRRVAATCRGDGMDNDALAARLEAEARAIHREDLEACIAMGRNGATLVPDNATILTHCNAGGLATAGYGTALGVIRAAAEAGKTVRVLADETRPFLQGSRLTAWELMRDGIDTTLITDNMAGHLMQRGKVDLVVVGSDRIAANGDVANKIGTYSVAVLAKENDIPFYVAAPTSTVDLDCPDGESIPIEERPTTEVTEIMGQPIAPEGVGVLNPAFDVTPARYVRAIVTEEGIAHPPYDESLAKLVTAADPDR